jgi:predicted nucleic acid-binding protein
VSGILYLDVCCFKRPFDDAALERVRREAEAVAELLDRVTAGTFALVRSPAHDFENERNPREDRRLATRLWLQTATRNVATTAGTVARARTIEALGFDPLDALHLAFAEQAAARWFVTTDDRLLRRARTHRDQLRVEVFTPDEVRLDQEAGAS